MLIDLKIGENVIKRFNSTTSTSKSPEANPIEEFENKTNNEFTEQKSTKKPENKSFENDKEKETHPFSIAQANK
jgi:hypothetical protein